MPFIELILYKIMELLPVHNQTTIALSCSLSLILFCFIQIMKQQQQQQGTSYRYMEVQLPSYFLMNKLFNFPLSNRSSSFLAPGMSISLSFLR